VVLSLQKISGYPCPNEGTPQYKLWLLMTMTILLQKLTGYPFINEETP